MIEPWPGVAVDAVSVVAMFSGLGTVSLSHSLLNLLWAKAGCCHRRRSPHDLVACHRTMLSLTADLIASRKRIFQDVAVHEDRFPMNQLHSWYIIAKG